ncbi:MAG TPA: sigma-54 dependent transcriptional regulator [Myxococcales bacterium]|nr:sigma-54 dependent transcriptional regulator [Myxococcales bacterium]
MEIAQPIARRPSAPSAPLLLADDEESALNLLKELLEARGRPVRIASTGAQALALLQTDHSLGGAVLDLRMPDVDGLTVLRRYRDSGGGLPIIMLSGAAEADLVVKAMKAGATDYLTKPLVLEDLLSAMERALRDRSPSDTGGGTADGGATAEPLWIGESPQMRRTWEIVERVANADVPVLVRGESGVGKEVVARELHRRSERRDRPFVKINCAALPAELLESELFGHERGAFTGATAEKPGKFELADRGTLFLDEIGEMDVRLQAKLLAVLQDQEFFRVGGKRSLKVDVRVVVATNRDLEEAIRQGIFREDLYYRLNVVAVRVAPLRERREDIRPLVEHFAAKYGPRAESATLISPALLTRFLEHAWPGNVRELENVVRRLVVLGDEQTVLSELAARGPALPGAPPIEREPSLKEVARRAAMLAERECILSALKRTGWNKRKAALRLRISYKALLYKIKECGIADPRDVA